jgi:hypothetical protein
VNSDSDVALSPTATTPDSPQLIAACETETLIDLLPGFAQSNIDVFFPAPVTDSTQQLLINELCSTEQFSRTYPFLVNAVLQSSTAWAHIVIKAALNITDDNRTAAQMKTCLFMEIAINTLHFRQMEHNLVSLDFANALFYLSAEALDNSILLEIINRLPEDTRRYARLAMAGSQRRRLLLFDAFSH